MRIRDEIQVFLLAVQFLTRLPVKAEWSAERMERTPRWYPAVGMAIGLLGGLVYLLAGSVLPALVAALLATAATVIATGAFHEDGFADCCDGLGGAVDRERALEIMRDSRLGTYGAVGLGLLMATKVAAIAALGEYAVAALFAGHALSRASAVTVIATGTYIRDHGTGKPVATGTGGMGLVAGLALLSLLPLALQAGLVTAAMAILGAAVGHVAMRRVFERRLGGYTGDCLGAVQQTSEVGIYLAVLLMVG